MIWKGGIRIVDMCELAKQMYCKHCRSVLDLNRAVNEKQVGLASVLTIVCLKCGQHNVVRSSQLHDTGNGEPDYFINIKASMSVQKTNICIEKLNAFLSDLGVPHQHGWRMLLDTSDSLKSMPDSHISSNDSHQVSQQIEPMDVSLQSAFDPVESDAVHKKGVSSPDYNSSLKREHDFSKVVTENRDKSSLVITDASTATEEYKTEGSPADVCQDSVNTEQIQLTAAQVDPNFQTSLGSSTDSLPGDGKHSHPERCFKQCSFPGHPAGDQCSCEPKNRFNCLVCGQAFSDVALLNQHRLEENHSSDTEGQPLPFACGKCDLTFATPAQLNSHIRTVHRKVGSKGRKSKEKSVDRRELGDLTFPDTSRIEEGAVACDGHDGSSAQSDLEGAAKGREFDMDADQSKEKKKITSVTSNCQFKCKVCPAVLSKARSFSQHMRQQHPEESSAYPCPHCPLRFRLLAQYYCHLVREHNERPFMCGDCGQSFKQPAQYSDHRQRHHTPSHNPQSGAGQSKRPFMCETCGNTYIRIFELRRHERVHTNDRAFRCGICGNSYLQLSHLISHRRTHTGERPYVCERCGKSFSQKSSLYLHSKTHREDLGMLECELCGNKLKNQRTMLKHRETCKGTYRKRYGDYRDFVCDKCGKDCRRRQGISYHRKTGCKVSSELQDLKDHLGMDSQGMFCTRCHKRCATQPLLLRHIRLECGQEGKPLNWSSSGYCRCRYCGEEFSSKGRRRYHVSAHCPRRRSGMLERPPEVKVTVDRGAPGYCVCSYCGEEFESKSKRRYHVSRKCAHRTKQKAFTGRNVKEEQG